MSATGVRPGVLDEGLLRWNPRGIVRPGPMRAAEAVEWSGLGAAEARALEAAGVPVAGDGAATAPGPGTDLETALERLEACPPPGPALARAARETLERCARKEFEIPLPRRTLLLGRRPCIMGILNVTPDSFSDGGLFAAPEAAAARAREMAAEGADLIDLGGESTRPGAGPVPAEEELRRVLPALEAVRAAVELPISVDTSKAAVAREALRGGAEIVNDVTALRDPEMAGVVAESGAALVLMHLRGTPLDMQRDPRYGHLLREVTLHLREALGRAVEAGIPEERLLVDPGFGFGKTTEHNLELLDRLGELRSLGRPMLAGVSRKSFLGAAAGAPAGRRLPATAAAVALAVERGAAVVRVHDVAAMREAALVGAAVRDRAPPGGS